VVDDDVVICRQMAANLSSAGYQVVTAHDGARTQAEEMPPDLAIVDLEMPGTNGLDVTASSRGCSDRPCTSS
jgi:DNA-binding response OmpR family regulator